MEHLPTFDLWSIAHVGAGLALAAGKVTRGLALVVILGTEVIELIFRRLGLFPRLFQESKQNVIADIVLSSLGFILGTIVFSA